MNRFDQCSLHYRFEPSFAELVLSFEADKREDQEVMRAKNRNANSTATEASTSLLKTRFIKIYTGLLRKSKRAELEMEPRWNEDLKEI